MKSKMEITLNERDTLSDMLLFEKQLMGFYSLAVAEAGSKELRRDLIKKYADLADGQFDVYEQMRTRGYYEVQPATREEIGRKKETFQKTEKQLETK